jgi:hypothetical protein
MNKRILLYLLAAIVLSFQAIAQTDNQASSDTAMLGLPGDNLDLFAVLDLFQKSKTIEDFEKSLNDEKTGINNLDLDLNGKVDFIKVVTKQDGNDFTFILQDDINEKEVQDVAVILVSKDKDGKVSLQIVGDKDLYGKDYVVEPMPAAPVVTPNPAYTGSDPVTATPAAGTTTTVVVVESTPIVQYVYSPVYVPYYPPYHYGFYPPYFTHYAVRVATVYRHNVYYHHVGYHGGYGNTVVIHNDVNFNNYNNSRRTSYTVAQHNVNGNYNANRPTAGTTQTGSSAARPSTTQSSSRSKASASTSNNKSKSSSVSSQTSTNRSSATRATGSSRSMGGRRR